MTPFRRGIVILLAVALLSVVIIVTRNYVPASIYELAFAFIAGMVVTVVIVLLLLYRNGWEKLEYPHDFHTHPLGCLLEIVFFIFSLIYFGTDYKDIIVGITLGFLLVAGISQYAVGVRQRTPRDGQRPPP